MAFKTADMVQETTSTTGNVTLQLNGAEQNHQSFAAGIGNGNTCPYTVFGQGDWETGIGTVTAGAPDTLSRDTVLASSNGNTKVSFAAGTKTIVCGYPAGLALTKDAGGNVGIGIAAPDGTLHVHTATAGAVTAVTDSNQLVLENNSNGGMTILTPDTNIGIIRFGSPSGAGDGAIFYNNSSNLMTFRTLNAERMRIDAAGKTSIGTLTALGNLHVSSGASGVGAANVLVDQLVIESSGAGGANILTPNNVRGAVYFGDPQDPSIGGIDYDHATDKFRIVVNNAARLLIDSSGNILIAKGSTGSSVVGVQLNADGSVFGTASAIPVARWNRIGDGVIVNYAQADVVHGTVAISGSTTTFNSLSDRRVKRNIVSVPVVGQMVRVRALEVREFEFAENPGIKNQGFVAQEVQAVHPEAVSIMVEEERDDAGNVVVEEKLGLDYGKMVVPLKLALDEAIDTINAQALTLATLDARLIALETAP